MCEIPVYVINLRDRTDRWDNVIEVLNKQTGIALDKIHRIEAVDTRNSTVDELKVAVKQFFTESQSKSKSENKKYKEDNKKNKSNVKTEETKWDDFNENVFEAIENGFRTHHHQLTSGSFGCFMSQITALRKVVDGMSDVAVIAEDDISFLHYKTLPTRLREFLRDKQKISRMMHSQKIDVLLLGHTGFHRDHPLLSTLESRIDPPEFIFPDWFMGLHFYVVTKASARKLLRLLHSPQKQIDWMIGDLVQREQVKVAAAVKRFIRVLDVDSDIQNHQPCHTPW